MINIKQYLWDKNISEDEALKDIEVFSRILNYADLDEIKDLIKRIGIKKIKEFVLKYPYKLEKRSLFFWRTICEIKRNIKETKRDIRNSCKIWDTR